LYEYSLIKKWKLLSILTIHKPTSIDIIRWPDNEIREIPNQTLWDHYSKLQEGKREIW
jgi:hypothetical protein